MSSEFSLSNVVPSYRLDGKVAVITGGSGGLASFLSRGLLSQGAEIALIDTNQQRIDEAAIQLSQWGVDKLGLKPEAVPKVTAWVCNIGDAANVEETFTAINATHGKLSTVMVNTAGYCENYPAESYPAANAENLMKVNGLGSLYVSQSFARPLIAAKLSGSIILIGSMSGSIVNTPQCQTMYNMSKAGVIHLTKSLACEWAPYNIRVNCLSPGYILTPLTKHVIADSSTLQDAWVSRIPQKRMAAPKEFVGSVLYLASDSASSYTTGLNMVVDGGYECW
ncbi:hypothetical protein BABINDRAFT_171894 [Babjeviella inositovora NRRL Y-12698]|uniref:D-arabinitol 2-dehydrogenase [ribulose-forming] n=1 Tax=Babjeviella inositovora NRRL Y-12698 TaxID=984486 RepID=A0A1E3QN50_9ASCO|nr:uncharacterized protein BABINDRAFT_171894 [Babjeviella inositovora NRRL Y-12698]ODQ79115.1 hypothetical protein BABINDRAFT_171894 [Babjeviella inositovora NRRL Y-12698]